MMQLGCCTGLPLDEQNDARLTRLGELGYDFVEFSYQKATALDEEACARVLRRLDETGLYCRSMNGFFPQRLPLTGPQADLGEARRYLEQTLPVAKRLGTSFVVFGSGAARRCPPGFPHDVARMQLIAFLRLCESYFADFGMTLVIEPLSYAECNMVNTVMDGYWLAQDADRPHIRLLADLFHVQRNRENPADLTATGKLLSHIHIADCSGRQFPTEAEADRHRPFFRALAMAHYDGGVSIEGSAAQFDTDAAVALQVMRRLRDETAL